MPETGPVLLVYQPGPEFLEAFFACLYAGVVAVPCEVPRSERHLPRFDAIRDDSGATAVLTTRATLDLIRRRLDPQAPRWIFTDEFDGARERVSPGKIAYLQYTSGSTSTPKGVIVTHDNVRANLEDIDATFRHTPDSIAVNWLPHFHDMGLVYGLLAPIYCGFRCYVMSPAAFVQRPARWLAAITKYRATHAGGPNFAYDLCVEKIAPELRAGFDLRSWRVAFNGAEPVRRETLESFAEAFQPSGFPFQSFHPAYGLAEATLKVTGRDPDRAVFCEGHRVSCGVPGPNTKVEIVDGEICVRGAGVAKGYWNRPDDPAFAGGVLHTGDLGYFSEGELFITGRAKDLIIVRGRNHYPQDVEFTTERAHPAIRPGFTAAFSIDVEGVERLAVVAELDRSRESESGDAIHAIRRAIAETHEVYAWSVVLVRTGSVPKTSSGKIQRQLAKQRYLAGELDVIAVSTGLPEFEQAPDSLAALERKMELEREYGIEVPVTALLGGSAIPGDLEEIPESREPVLSVEQERLWLLDRIEPGNPAFHVPAAMEFDSSVDLPRLERALVEVVHHHETLRTTYGSRPVVHAEMPVALRSGPATEAFVLEPFDLARGPLFRGTVDGRRVTAVFHHIVADLWSAAIFFRDLAAAYAGLALEPLSYTFNDFAAWQRSRLASGALDPSIDFWRRKLANLPHLSWPGAHREPGIEEFIIAAPVAARLHELAKQHQATPAMTFLTAWQALLQRVTTQEDLVVATPVAGRPRAEFAGVIGFFAYPVLLRTDVSGDPSFAELLDRTRSVALEAYSQAEVPFSKIVDLVSAGGHCQVRAPLAHTVFNFVRTAAGAADAPPAPTDFDTFLTLIERPDGTLRGVLAHNLGRPTANALAAAYTQALEAFSNNPEALVNSIALPEAIRPRPRITLAIAASFTAEPLEPVLSFWMDELGTPARIHFADFGQVFQSLLDPSSRLSRNRDGANLVLVRPDDLKDSTAEFVDAVRNAAARSRVPLIIAACPPSAGFDTVELAAIPGVHIITPERVAELYPVETIEDPHGDELAHVPYTTAYFTALGTTIARTISAIRRAPYKVIAVDCDQTLWKGVCGEDGPEGIELDAGRLAVQRALVRQHEAGMLLALCSKNNEEDVDAVFETRRDMPLTESHFVARRLNWHPKPDNLRSLARDLMLGLDSFIFIDDNPVECAAVRAALPEVLTVELPEDPTGIEPLLNHLWPLDHLRVTSEDRARTEMYKQDVQRRQLETSSVSLAAFLAGLDLRVQIAPAQPGQLARVAQLTQRTNQFNCNAVRYNEPDLRSPESEVVAVSASDRFGDYGIVGVLIFSVSAESLIAGTFLLSCRALGRGIEHRMMAALGEMALQRGLPYVEVLFSPTRKNRPALQFLEQAGATTRRSAEGPTVYRLAASAAAACIYQPEAIAAAPVPADETNPIGSVQAPRLDWLRFARDYQTVDRIEAAILARRTPAAPVAAVGQVDPRTPLESQLAALWAHMLHVESVSVDADFFSIGGHSLLAVQLLSRVRDQFDVELSLDVVFGGRFTVAELARAIELAEIQRSGPLPERLLAEIESLSEEEALTLLRSEANGGSSA